MTVVIGIIVVLLVVGSLIAIAWWKISARAAPYADEAGRQNAARRRRQQEIEQNTFVIGDDGVTSSTHSGSSARTIGVAANALGAAAAHGAHSVHPNPATTPVERDVPGTSDSGGVLYSGPDADTTGFGGGGSSYDGGGMDSGGSSDSGDSYA